MIFFAPSKFRTCISPLPLRAINVQRSVTREVSLSGDGSAAGWWKSRTHHPALFTRVQIGSVARARRGALPHYTRNLAGRARGNTPVQPLSSGPGVPR